MNQLAEVRVLSATEIAEKLASLRTAEKLAGPICSLKMEVLAHDELHDRLIQLVDDGTLADWAAAFEAQQLRAKCEGAI